MDAGSRPDRQSPASVASLAELHQAIRRRAEQLYVLSGRVPGRDMDNWMQAEAEIRREREEQSARKAAIVVKVHGVRYVGEYSLASADGYTAGEFVPGAPLPLRFEGDRMYVKRRNGKELETRIVRKNA